MGGMGGKKKKGSNVKHGSQSRVCMTLREESSGKKQVNVNAKSMCKLDHLKNLAVWAGSEASIPSLGAFFGERLAATTEALGLRADPSLFACERCESILQPGDNCTVRIEKNRSKVRHRRKKSNPATQNNIVYRCHFCSHRNLMRGTPKGYLKQVCPPKPKPPRKLEPVEKHNSLAKASTSIPEVIKVDTIALAALDDGPATPVPISGLTLLDSKRKKRNRSGVKKVAEPQTSLNAADTEQSTHASSKRRKKAWTSLKEIAAQSSEKKVSNLSIPFFI